MDRPDEPEITNPLRELLSLFLPDSGVNSAVDGHLQVRDGRLASQAPSLTGGSGQMAAGEAIFSLPRAGGFWGWGVG